jgi:hypothetical protein
MAEPNKVIGIPMGQWSGADATHALHETIRAFGVKSDRQTRTMIGLTWAIAILTLAMLGAVAFQIYVDLHKHTDAQAVVSDEGGPG